MPALAPDQLQKIFANAPAGTSRAGIMAGLQARGYTIPDISEVPQAVTSPSPTTSTPQSFLQTVGKFVPGNIMATGAAQALATPGAANAVNQSSQLNNDQALMLEKRIRATTDPVKRAALIKLRTQSDTGLPSVEDIATNGQGYVKPRQVVGDAASLALTAGTGAINPATSVLGRIGQGAAVGGGFGAANAIGNADSIGQAATDIGLGAGIGAAGTAAGEGINSALKFVGGLTEDTGKAVLNSQADLTGKQVKATDLGNTMQSLKNVGISNINDFPAAAEAVTGNNGALSKMVRAAVADAPRGVNLSGMSDMVDQLVADPNIPQGADAKLAAKLKGILAFSQGGAKGSISATAEPLDVFDSIKSLEKLANNPKGDPNINDVYKEIASELKDRLFTNGPLPGNPEIVGAGADSAVASSKESGLIEQLRNAFPNNKKWGAFINEVEKAPNVSTLRSLQRPFVNASAIEKATTGAATNASTGLLNNKFISVPIQQLEKTAAPYAANALSAAGRGLNKGAQAISPIMKLLTYLGMTNGSNQ